MWGCEIGGEENFSERLCLLFLGIGSDLNEDLELWVLIFLKWGGQNLPSCIFLGTPEILMDGGKRVLESKSEVEIFRLSFRLAFVKKCFEEVSLISEASGNTTASSDVFRKKIFQSVIRKFFKNVPKKKGGDRPTSN